MRIKLKHLPIHNIFHRLKKRRTGTKHDCEGSQTDKPVPQILAVPKAAEVEPEFELGSPLKLSDSDNGPTTIPSTTFITSHEHLGIYPPGHPAAASRISIPQITIEDSDGNGKIATSIHETSASESKESSPHVLGSDDTRPWSGRPPAVDATQESVNLALTKALQSDGLVSGFVDRIIAALVPVLDERIKMALDDARDASTESNGLHASENLDPILEESEQLSPLDLLLERNLGISDTKLQSVKEPIPPSTPTLPLSHPLTRSPALRGSPRQKRGRDLNFPKAPPSPVITPHRYPAGLPTPESHRDNRGYLLAGGNVESLAVVTPTHRTTSGKLFKVPDELVIGASSIPEAKGEAPSTPVGIGRLLFGETEKFALPEANPGHPDTALYKRDVFTAVPKADVSASPMVTPKSTEAEPKVSTAYDRSCVNPSLLQLCSPLPEATLEPAPFSRPGHLVPFLSNHTASQRHSMGSPADNPLLHDPAIICVGPHLIGGYPAALADDETGAGTYPAGCPGAPSDVKTRSSGNTISRTDTPPAPPAPERRRDGPSVALRSLSDFLNNEMYSLEWIGGGVSGDVHRATGNDTGRTPRVRFALKFLPLYHRLSREAAVLEARALLKISKAASIEGARHVLRIDSAPEALLTGHAVVKMPYYQNTLHDYAKMLSRGSLLFVIAEVTKGLQFLHSIPIVHLDLKPANIFVDDEGHCVIGDFSGSYMGPLPKLATEQWSTMTPEYMPPEISIAQTYSTSTKFDERADIWCLGISMYLLICGFWAVKQIRGQENPDFTDYDDIGLNKDTMIQSMNGVSCSGTVQKLVLEMCQMDQNLRWNTKMIQRYLEERNYWRWDGASPLLRYSVKPVKPRSDYAGRGMATPDDILPNTLRKYCETYMNEVYTHY